jgi:hypothetical protein
MPTPAERAQAQALYLEVLHARAKAVYDKEKATLPIDPQGRVLLDVTLTAEDWEQIYQKVALPANTKAEFFKQLGHEVTDTTTVSIDLQTGSKDALTAPLAKGLGQHLPADKKDTILERYQGLSKGRIISLQQETHFHAHLIGRMVRQAVEREGRIARFGDDKDALFKQGLDKALLKLNDRVLELQANALNKAYEKVNKKTPFDENEFAKQLNKGLDEARKKLLPEIAKDVRVELIKATGIQFDHSITQHLSKHLAEETSASTNDFVHLNKASGSISFIGASDKTSHHQEMGGDHTADRMMYSHHLKESGEVEVLAQRQQVRVPSLAVKRIHKITEKLLDNDEKQSKKKSKSLQDPLLVEDTETRIAKLAAQKELSISPSELTQIKAEYDAMRMKIAGGLNREAAFNALMIEDTSKKIAHLQQKYQLGDVDRGPGIPQAFVYNLYTSINKEKDFFEQIDEKSNKQRQSAEHILAAAHDYNRTNPDKPLCLVQNIAVNGWGHELSIDADNPAVVNEAALMAQLASLHTVYDALHDDVKPVAQEIFADYDKFRKDPTAGLSFYSYIQANNLNTLNKLGATKNKDLPPPKAEDNFATDAKYALASLFQDNALSHHDNGFTYQALSVFVENASIGGCKSANERAQAVNGRVSILDFVSLNKDTREKLLDKYLSETEANRLKQAASDLESAIKTRDLPNITKSMNALYESLNLEGFQAVISFIDQGGHAKLGTRGRIPNTNNAETVHTDVEKASSWQCHKGLTDNVLKEFCGIQKTSVKADIKKALTMVAVAVGGTGIALGIAAAVGVAAAFPPVGILIGAAAVAGLLAFAVTKLYSHFTKAAATEKRFGKIQEENAELISGAAKQAHNEHSVSDELDAPEVDKDVAIAATLRMKQGLSKQKPLPEPTDDAVLDGNLSMSNQ